MQKQKGISTLVGIAIIVVAIIVLFGGVFAWQYFTTQKLDNLPQIQNQQVNNAQPANQTASWKTYKNDEYGFEVSYPNDYNAFKNVIIEKNKFFVGGKNGQWVEIFAKNSSETFEAAIRRIILEKYPSSECKIEISIFPANSFRGEYQHAQISYPPSNDENAPWANASLCNENYAKTNGIRYFLFNPLTPDKFAFFDIGQYAITIGNENKMPWQDTFKFTK